MPLCFECRERWKRQIGRKQYKAYRKSGQPLKTYYPSWVYFEGDKAQCRYHMAMSNRDNAKRRASKLNATPKWADAKAIAAIYDQCSRITRETGIEHEVDHIVPLRGRNVCGLHIAINLQILKANKNRQKGNRFNDETISEAQRRPAPAG